MLYLKKTVNYRHRSDLNEEACCVKKDVEVGDEENDVLVGDVDDGVVGVGIVVAAVLIRFGFLLDSGKAFFLFIFNKTDIHFYISYFFGKLFYNET